MWYYTFDRTYKVKAHSFKEARIKFSRALENNEEDQYYVETTFQFPENTHNTGVLERILQLLPWFFEEVRNQVFGYPQYKRS